MNIYRRYHYSIYLPDDIGDMLVDFFNQLNDTIGVTYHGTEQSLEDKRSVIPTPSKEELMHSDNMLIEVYELLDDDERTSMLQKVVIRVPHLSDKYDFTYVIAREGFLVSAWCNDKDDIHRLTMSRSNYYDPEILEELA